MVRKPDFFVVGAAKSGTSSLYNYLAQHPAVFMAEPKEPHFFSEYRPPVEEVRHLDEYLDLFQDVPDSVRAGEASTSYLYSEIAAHNIDRFRPDAKIIAVLRDPVSRAYSQYWNQVQEGVEPLSFEEALAAEPERIEQGWWYGFHYVEGGRYAGQVERYMDIFGRESVKVYLLEDLQQDASGVCRDIFSFLRVDPDESIRTEKTHNPGGAPRSALLAKVLRVNLLLFRWLGRRIRLGRGGKGGPLPTDRLKGIKNWLMEKNAASVPKMKPDTRTMLRRTFREDVLRLEGLIARDLRHWLG